MIHFHGIFHQGVSPNRCWAHEVSTRRFTLGGGIPIIMFQKGQGKRTQLGIRQCVPSHEQVMNSHSTDDAMCTPRKEAQQRFIYLVKNKKIRRSEISM